MGYRLDFIVLFRCLAELIIENRINAKKRLPAGEFPTDSRCCFVGFLWPFKDDIKFCCEYYLGVFLVICCQCINSIFISRWCCYSDSRTCKNETGRISAVIIFRQAPDIQFGFFCCCHCPFCAVCINEPKGYWNNLKTPELNTKIIFLRKCALYCPAILSESKGYYCQIITIIKILCHWTSQNDSWFAAIDKNSFDCRNGAGGLPLIEFKTVVMWGKIW